MLHVYSLGGGGGGSLCVGTTESGLGGPAGLGACGGLHDYALIMLFKHSWMMLVSWEMRVEAHCMSYMLDEAR